MDTDGQVVHYFATVNVTEKKDTVYTKKLLPRSSMIATVQI